MGYRIRYEVRRRRYWPWALGGLVLPVLAWGADAVQLWQGVQSGEGWYLSLARFVGEMIRGAH